MPNLFGDHVELVNACAVTAAVGIRISQVAQALAKEKQARMDREQSVRNDGPRPVHTPKPDVEMELAN
jgi:uncharacterized metal-binding protein